jgi:Gas vesicle synthesis protein GvpL/GvpF/Lsr2
MMATITREVLTCDLCGDSDDVQTQEIGLDGKTYEVDLCRKDSDSLTRIAAGYIGKARQVSARRRARRKPRGSHARTPAARDKAKPNTRDKAKPNTRDNAKPNTRDKAKPKTPRVLVYGVLPGDVEVADETPGVGEQPGPLRIVHSDGLAALISELGPSGQLGTPGDREAYREILDGTALEVPVVPLRFGTVLASEDAVADELLDVRHDDFAGALEGLDGRVEFVVSGRYAGEATAPGRTEALRALEEAMQEHCVASVAREPDDERDEVRVAFLVNADQEGDVQRVIGDLAEQWEGRIELEIQGPTAAYDFVDPGEPQG